MLIAEIAAMVMIAIGVFFCVVGVVGMIRLPDVYSRIHASGKVAVLGVVGLLIGLSILRPMDAPRALALTAFLVITSPVASHAIASAAFRNGVKRENCTRDDLATQLEPKRQLDAGAPRADDGKG